MTERARIEARLRRTMRKLEQSFDRLTALLWAERLTPLVLERLRAEGLLRENVGTEDRVKELTRQEVLGEFLREETKRQL